MSSHKIFLYSCLNFIISTAIASFAPIKESFFCFVLFEVFLVLAIIFWKNKKLRIIFIFCLSFFLAFWRYGISIHQEYSGEISYYNDNEIVFNGYICQEPEKLEKSQRLEICVRGVKIENNFDDVSGIVLTTTEKYPEYEYGENLEIIGKIIAPEDFNGFAYDRYLAKSNIYSVSYYPEIKKIDGFGGSRIKEFFIKIRKEIKKNIDRGLKEPESSLANAMILGYKRGISDDLREQFSKAGLSHIMAISGLHISILSGIVMYLFLGLGMHRRRAFIFSSIFLFSYIFLIGFPASAMRAGIMAFMVLLAINLGRTSKLINSLVFVACVLLLINPKLLRDDIGFQLSFLAVLGIAIFYPIFERIINKRIKNNFLKVVLNIFSLTISAQIFTTPIVAINFGVISLIAPVSNLLVLWSLPFVIISICVAVISSYFLPAISFLLFLPSFLLLKYIIFIANIFANLPFSSM